MRLVWTSGLVMACACSGQSERGPEQNDPGSVTSTEGPRTGASRDTNPDDSLAPPPDSLRRLDGAAESRPAVIDSPASRGRDTTTPGGAAR